MRFDPISTDRLVIRHFRPSDVSSLHARRNEPEVARYQDWTLPYPESKAAAIGAALAQVGGPAHDQWWMAVVDEATTGETVGDLAVRLEWEGRAAEIGYTFSLAHWGRGFAVEAVTALLDWLFSVPEFGRAHGSVHPENVASARVLERTGFLFEGHTRMSYWVGDESSDDWIYGLTRADWEAWRDRPTGPPATVELVAITHETLPQVRALQTHWSQRAKVAPMDKSFANALFPPSENGGPLVPWLRAVVADGEYVGFVMLAVSTEFIAEPWLWRLLIDRLHQRRGIGTRVLDLLVEECRKMGDDSLMVSWVPGRWSPEPVYLRYGFEPTGVIEHGEVQARYLFPSPAGGSA